MAVAGATAELDFEAMTVEDGLQLIQVERVEPLLKYLRTGVFENKTNVTFMNAYSVVVRFGDEAMHAIKLYAYYKSIVQQFCNEGIISLADVPGNELLRKAADLWEKMAILTYWMQRVFQYLDRFYTKNNKEQALFEAALNIFNETVYENAKENIISAMVNEITNERNGQAVDQGVLRQITELLCTVDGKQAKIDKIPKVKDGWRDKLVWQYIPGSIYKTDFETRLIAATSDYYKSKAAGWLAEFSCPVFLREVEKVFDAEEKRILRYLDNSTTTGLLAACRKELIGASAKHLTEMSSGCLNFLQNGRYEDLSLMYRLFKLEPTTLVHVTAVVESFIQDRFKTIVDDKQNIDNPQQYIELVLAAKKEIDSIIAKCFAGDDVFQKIRNKSLETVLNKDTRCAKYLAHFCDVQLRKGIKGLSEDDTAQLVASVISLFSLLRDKDIFLESYKRSLSKRLLNKCAPFQDVEDMFITKLKQEVGQQAIQKLLAMFTDMMISDQLQSEFKLQPHGGSPEGIAHDVRVLQANAWPEKAEEANVCPGPELQQCITAYESFYYAKHSGRKLRWLFHMGNVELVALGFERRYILSVSTYQGLALLFFNKNTEVSFADILQTTKIPREECHRQVISMTATRHKLLLHDSTDKKLDDSTKLHINAKFTFEKIKVSMSLVKQQVEKTVEPSTAETPLERKHVLDAAVVRVMKARKRLAHNFLLEEVFKQCTMFKPQPSQIKTIIEALIEREFLKRDPDDKSIYIYLP